ncbi:MAG: glycosyltransferase family 2 protein [Chloroflexota bacterium]
MAGQNRPILKEEQIKLPPLDPAIDLSIIIVSWNVVDLLRACLTSIFTNGKGISLEVIVVDSASSDASVKMVKTEFPQVTLIARSDNVGFPKGNNIGLEAARGRFIYLLNPDTIVVDSALQTMLAYLDAHPQVGLVGSQLRFPDGEIQASRRRFPTLWTGIFESTWLQEVAPKRILAHYYMEDKKDDEICEADWVMGASMLLRREVAEACGGMDAAYFMYSEELDWCRRIREAGWKIVYLPTAQIIHYQGKSSEQASTARHINFNRAKIRYFRKYHGPLASGAIRSVLLLNYGWQIVLESVKGLTGHKRDLRKQRVSSYWQVLKSGLPPAGY